VTTKAEGDELYLRGLVAQAGAILHHRGLIDYLGHCSARVRGTDRILIKPKHSIKTTNPGRLSGEDMLVIDLDGRVVDGEDQPPAEFHIHTEIYRARPDVLGIVHTHQSAATIFGTLDVDLVPLLHVPSVLTEGGRVRKWPCPLLVTTRELGAALAETLGAEGLCHLQGHGIVSVDTDLRKATVTAIALEELARANLMVLQTGRAARAITEDELSELSRTVAPVDGRWAYYVQELP
jgi:ribulose-5-phosphate 4-epimerase/fuculose-1-phosphate aldolase